MKASNVRSYKDIQLLDRMSKLPSFKGFPKGFFDIWVRSEEDEYNVFDDKVYTFYGYGDAKLPKFMMVTIGTTNAGSEGLKNFGKYNSKGCAVLKANHIVYDYAVRRKHKGKYVAWCQDKPWPYFRDGDKDNKAEQQGKEYHDIIGANCHAAGMKSSKIDSWSVACLVRNIREDFDKWMEMTEEQETLTVCILQEF
jgi:hypothetical protein